MNQNPVASKNPSRWDYCDLKCLYLEKYHSDKDFVVLVMGATLKDDFAACYVKTTQGYTIWNKVVSNKYYEKHCGMDKKDWANSGDFQIKKVLGLGIGTQIDENQSYR